MMKEIIEKLNLEQDLCLLSGKEDKELRITFIKHSSLVFEYKGLLIYNDPVMDYVDYNLMPKADIILISHEHYDHFDPKAIEVLKKKHTIIVSNPVVYETLKEGICLRNGERADLIDCIKIKALPAYNTTLGRDKFHPRHRDNGYVLDLEGSKIYIAGDTELIPEMKELKDQIEIAFLPVNQPYTMTIDQATEAALQINPKILYPYHYGETQIKTPINDLKTNLKDSKIDVRIRKME